ncbi:Uncharacterised protein [uncultured archaeon]|nr:Uncharacterised protein [uncultured archaeon]
MNGTEVKLEKAKLIEIEWDDKNPPDPPEMVGKGIDVQFNPQTLKLTYSNQLSGGDKSGKSSKQFVGKGTTKLSLDLWFDVTVPVTDSKKKKMMCGF